MKHPIATERLLLRKYQDRDALDILEYSLEADYWLARNLDWESTEDGVRKYYEARQDITPESFPDWFNLVIELKSENKVVGNVGLGVKDKDQRQAEIGWLLAQKYQGQGIATESASALITFGFDTMGLHRIYASTSKLNVRSWALMERLGMRREAHFWKSHLINDEWDDAYIYAILAEEWNIEKTRGSPSRVDDPKMP